MKDYKRKIQVHVKKIKNIEQLIPEYKTVGSSGCDLKANINEDIIIYPNETKLIPTGLKLQFSDYYEIQIRSRSGLALKNNVIVLDSPATIDSDYRGEIGVILKNFGKENFVVKPLDRIAQMIVVPVYKANFIIEKYIDKTDRGDGGYGHTGI